MSRIKTILKTANIFYVVPYYRCACYVIGMLTALLLRGQRRSKLSLRDQQFGWFLATLGLILAYGISVVNHVNHTALNMAIFNSFAPLIFCSFFLWIIYFRQQGFESELKFQTYLINFNLIILIRHPHTLLWVEIFQNYLYIIILDLFGSIYRFQLQHRNDSISNWI